MHVYAFIYIDVWTYTQIMQVYVWTYVNMYINVLVKLIFGEVLPPYTVSLSLIYVACEMVRTAFEETLLCYDPIAANHMWVQAIMFKERKSFVDVG